MALRQSRECLRVLDRGTQLLPCFVRIDLHLRAKRLQRHRFIGHRNILRLSTDNIPTNLEALSGQIPGSNNKIFVTDLNIQILRLDLVCGSALSYKDGARGLLGPEKETGPAGGNRGARDVHSRHNAKRNSQMFTTVEVTKEEISMATMSRGPIGSSDLRSVPVTIGQPLRKSGVQVVAGYMPAGALIPGNYDIPTYDARTGKGYQRPLQEARVNELVTDLKKNRVDLPTAILLNLRNQEARQAVKEGQLRLAYLRESASNILFRVVDGQHRVAALSKLIAEDPDGEWTDFLIPFVCMVGATEEQEMEQFYVVNSRAKPVRTDLALALLRKLSDRDPKMLERMEEKGKAWQVAAEKLVESMAEHSSVWRGLIRLAGIEKGGTTMPSASMVTSLKPLLGSSFFSRLSFAQQQQVVEAFWTGLRNAMRPAFDDPSQYVIQKGVGVVVLHAILVDVMEIVRSTNRSVIDASTYEEIMQGPMEKLQGEAQDGFGTPVQGVDFWRTAPTGAAGSYSSGAGRRVLISKIRQLLPNVEVL